MTFYNNKTYNYLSMPTYRAWWSVYDTYGNTIGGYPSDKVDISNYDAIVIRNGEPEKGDAIAEFYN